MGFLRKLLGIEQPALEDVIAERAADSLKDDAYHDELTVTGFHAVKDVRAPGDSGEIEPPAEGLDGVRAMTPSEVHRRDDRAIHRTGAMRSVMAHEDRSITEIASDLLLASPSGDQGKVSGQNMAQQLQEAVQALQGENERLRAERMALPSSDAQAELNQIRALLGAAPGEVTVDAVMRTLETRRIVDGIPVSLTGRLIHMGAKPAEIQAAITQALRLEVAQLPERERAPLLIEHETSRALNKPQRPRKSRAKKGAS